MKSFYTAILLLVMLVSCDQSQVVTGASDELKAAIEFNVTPLGKATDRYREFDLYDYTVTIKNNWKSPVFLTCSTPAIHSEYIRKRNPDAINYMTFGVKGARNLSDLGLMGSGGTKELKQGDEISFIAPIPVIPGREKAGEFVIHITLYLDSKIRQGRSMRSDPVKFSPKG